MTSAEILAMRYAMTRAPVRKPKRMKWPAALPPERPPDARRRELAVDLAAQLVVEAGQPIAEATTSAILRHVRDRFTHPAQWVALAIQLHPLIVDEIQRRTLERIAKHRRAKHRRRKTVRAEPMPPDLPTSPGRRRNRRARTVDAVARVLERSTDRGISGIGRAAVSRCKCSHGRDSHLFRLGSSPCTWSDCGCELFRPASLRSDDVS